MALKWYTRARKIPQMIGRTPDGTRIPGGPYTFTQVFAGVAAGGLLWLTPGVWARGGLLASAIVALAVIFGAVYLTGQLPPGMRNPLVLGTGLLKVFSSGFTLDGSPMKRAPLTARRASARVTVFELESSLANTEPQLSKVTLLEPDPQTTADLASPPTDRPALSAVQRLILGEQV